MGLQAARIFLACQSYCISIQCRGIIRYVHSFCIYRLFQISKQDISLVYLGIRYARVVGILLLGIASKLFAQYLFLYITGRMSSPPSVWLSFWSHACSTTPFFIPFDLLKTSGQMNNVFYPSLLSCLHIQLWWKLSTTMQRNQVQMYPQCLIWQNMDTKL